MRIPITCLTCRMEALGRGDELPSEFYVADLSDDMIYSIQCERGHKHVSVLDAAKYEVLFESGACALLYGFHREAVTSFGTALERYLEFAARVLWEAWDVPAPNVEDAWTVMSKQSERQIGALFALYLARFGEAFPTGRLGLQGMTTFRNTVVHHGVLPTAEQAHTYAGQVFAVITETRAKFVAVEDLKQAEDRTHLRLLAEAHRKAREKHRVNTSTQALSMILTRVFQGGPDTFDARLGELRERLPMLVVRPRDHDSGST